MGKGGKQQFLTDFNNFQEKCQIAVQRAKPKSRLPYQITYPHLEGIFFFFIFIEVGNFFLQNVNGFIKISNADLEVVAFWFLHLIQEYTLHTLSVNIISKSAELKQESKLPFYPFCFLKGKYVYFKNILTYIPSPG